MNMKTVELSSRFVQRISELPHLQHATVRVGVWLLAVADKTGSESVELFYTHFLTGYKGIGAHEGVSIKGINFRPPTVNKALQSLVDEGVLSIKEGSTMRNGYPSKVITLHP